MEPLGIMLYGYGRTVMTIRGARRTGRDVTLISASGREGDTVESISTLKMPKPEERESILMFGFARGNVLAMDRFRDGVAVPIFCGLTESAMDAGVPAGTFLEEHAR